MKILVIGTGAIGSFYGASLAKAGAEVSFVARSDYVHLTQHGVAIHDEKIGDWHFKPHAVYRSAKEAKAAAIFDCVMLCVKMTKGIDKVALVRDALSADTAIVLIANGLDIEVDLAAAFPHHELISIVTSIYVTRTAPGKIWYQGSGTVALGNYPKGTTVKLQQLADMFDRAGIKASVTENIVTQRWEKTLWNAPFNPISVLTGLTVDKILHVDEKLVRSLMGEIATIAEAAGHPLVPDAIDKRIAFTKSMPPYKTSMLVDYEAGRPLEVEAILGAPVRTAQRLGIAAPQLETLYGLLKMREGVEEKESE